jgi:hypothetical protein
MSARTADRNDTSALGALVNAAKKIASPLLLNHRGLHRRNAIACSNGGKITIFSGISVAPRRTQPVYTYKDAQFSLYQMVV